MSDEQQKTVQTESAPEPTAQAEETPQITQDATDVSDAEEPRFTKADVEKIIRQRLERERKKHEAEIAELREKAQRLSQYEEAQKTEEERLRSRVEEAEQRAAEAAAMATDRLIQAAFLAEAGKHGVRYPLDAYLLADLSRVEIDEDGNVAGVAEIVKELVDGGRLATARPTAPALDAGKGSGGKPKELLLSPEEEAIARKLGLTTEQYAQGKKRLGKQS